MHQAQDSSGEQSGDTPQLLIESFTDLPIASLSHSTDNLGDWVQTIAADQFTRSIQQRFDREKLHSTAPAEDYALILNGWFAHNVETSFPPHPALNPVIIGFHIYKAKHREFSQPNMLDYFIAHQPIGCRDLQTCELLQSHGIDAFVSGCLTMTLPLRTREPAHPKVVIVDLPKFPRFIVPRKLRRNAVYKSHKTPPFTEEHTRDLLNFYRDNAGLIITSRLHCALPCVAMGIPVVLFSDKDPGRMSAASLVGLPIHRMQSFSRKYKPYGGPVRSLIRRTAIALDVFVVRTWHKLFRPINWSPEPLNTEGMKAQIREHLSDQFKNLQERLERSE